ncbi:MAG: hypothetical protein U1C53_01255 [Candidatus Veblenbacteria bacterium]|nr:hypothetical protein [Candidatus Veblenbacteria bacterium]MDZ4229742.1 hypothetical protein [Candidatus Veblenbacteria bacterium]
MTLRQYLSWLALGTGISWGAFGLVLSYLNPETAGNIGFLFFYLSVFLSLTGTLTLIGFAWRYLRHRDEVLFRHVSISFRQGVLLAFMVVVALWLEAHELLTWWNLGLLVVGLTLLEFFWLSVRRSAPSAM